MTIFPTYLNLDKNASGTESSSHRVSVNTSPPSAVVFLATRDNHSSRSSQGFEGSDFEGNFHKDSRAMSAGTGAKEMGDRVLIR